MTQLVRKSQPASAYLEMPVDHSNAAVFQQD
jgi:hypothetical protein